MPTDLYSQVLLNDGEGLDFNDLNNVQRFASAQISDGLLQYMVGALKPTINATTRLYDPDLGGQNGADTDTRYAYCLSPGQAFLRQGTTNGRIQIAPGTLFMKVGAAAGADSTLMSYTFVGTEEWTLTNGHATNPRIDLLQMKLEYISDTATNRDFKDAITGVVTSTTPNKKRRIQCTLSVKAGTPAVIAEYPQPDAGFVPVGAVVVGNGWTTGAAAPIFGVDSTALNNLVVHDLRMPVNVKAYRVDPAQFHLVSGWGDIGHGDRVLTVGGANCQFSINGGTGAVAEAGIGLQAISVTTAFTGATTLSWNIPMRAGDRVKSVTIRARDTGGITPNAIPFLDVAIINRSGAVVVSLTLATVGLTGSFADVISNIADTTLAVGDSLLVACSGTVSLGVQVQCIEVTFDRPPNNGTLVSDSTSNLLYIPVPAPLGKLVGVHIHLDSAIGTWNRSASANNCMDVGQSSRVVGTSYVPRQSVNVSGTPFAAGRLLQSPLWGLEVSHIQGTLADGVGPEISETASSPATAGYGPPVWTNGRRCPHEKGRLTAAAAEAPVDCLVARVQSGQIGTILGAVTFFVAEGI